MWGNSASDFGFGRSNLTGSPLPVLYLTWLCFRAALQHSPHTVCVTGEAQLEVVRVVVDVEEAAPLIELGNTAEREREKVEDRRE